MWGDVCAPTPTPAPTTVPTPTTEQLKAEYTPLADVRELAIRTSGMEGDKLFFYGRIFNIEVVNDFAFMQLYVAAPDGTEEAVVVTFPADTSGMFEGTYVAVWGTVVGSFTGTNAFGGEIRQPWVDAQFLEFA